MIDSNNQLKTLSKSLLNAVLNVMEATKDAGTPMSAKQKELAAKAPPYDKITHADVLVGRGVLKKHPTHGKLVVAKEEAEQVAEGQKPYVSSESGGIGRSAAAHVLDSKGKIVKSFHKKEHGTDYMKKASDYLDKNYNNMKNEEAEGLDELSGATLGSYERKSAPDRNRDAGNQMAKRKQLGSNKVNVASSEMNKARPKFEEVETIDELSTDKLMDYRAAAKKQGTGIQNKMKMGGGDWSKDGKDTNTLSKRLAGYKMAGRKTNPDLAASVGKGVKVAANEEVELDEALDAAARYGQHHVAIKDLLKSIDQHVKNHKNDALKHRDYKGKKGVHWGHVGDLAQVHSHLADIHDRLAQQGEYKMSMVGESVDDYNVEQIDELSKKTLNTYRGNAYNDYLKKSANRMPGDGETDAMKKRMKSLNLAADKLTKEDHDFIESLNNNDLDEARGRPRKVPLPVGDVEPEPRQHVMQQLQRAKLSMRGGEDVVFKDGKKAHVSGAHAARVLTKYAGMKPGDKEDYQKKIGASHEAFKEHM